MSLVERDPRLELQIDYTVIIKSLMNRFRIAEFELSGRYLRPRQSPEGTEELKTEYWETPMYQPSKAIVAIAPSLLSCKVPYIPKREALVILIQDTVLRKNSHVILKVTHLKKQIAESNNFK